MNAMVTQYDKGVFGEDSYEFRPERWLCGEEQWRIMDKAMLVFGAGTRTCIGKHVRLRSWKYYLKNTHANRVQLSNAEMYKLVPEFFRLFTIEMAHDQPWKTHNATFVLQSNVICKVKRRAHANVN
jgi:hypothetical protein